MNEKAIGIGNQPRKCRGCGGAITVTKEVWRGKERFMIYHSIPKCDWFAQAEAARQAAAVRADLAEKERSK